MNQERATQDSTEQPSAADLDILADQLGRRPRGVRAIAARCPAGHPSVVETEPLLPDGTPFPTVFYLTCPALSSTLGTLESVGVMTEMNQRLAEDPDLAARYAEAHRHYLAHREAIAPVARIEDVSAGGMPTRVKCLHALAAHALAAGPGVNPIGDEVLDRALTRLTGEGHGRSDHVRRVAAIDCGTNSIRLLVAALNPAPAGVTSEDERLEESLTDLDRRLEIVRLGQGVDETKRLAPEALERTFDACRRYAAVIESFGAAATRFVATSASRDAENRDEFVAGVRDILGVTPEVVTGDEEAALTFDGGTRDSVPADAAEPYLVLDIGGGSTEFVLGGPAYGHPSAVSVDLGSVRLTERVLRSDPPTRAEIDDAIVEVDARIDEAERVVPLWQTRTFVGLAGTVTTVAAAALDLPSYQPERIHRAVLTASGVHRTAERLLGMTVAERRALPFMHPGRADVIGAGALILDRIVRRVAPGLEQLPYSAGGVGDAAARGAMASGLDPADYSPEPALIVSEHDILDGIAWSLLT